MFITDADRAGALRIAKARVQRQHRGTGIYPVTVGGYVVGQVERIERKTVKNDYFWAAIGTDGKRVGGLSDTRKDAVEALAKTDEAAEAYRESAREDTQGTAEERRVREEDTARLEELDAVAEESSGPALELVEGAYRTADGRFTVRRIEADTYRIEDERASRVRYDRSIADARETIGKILGVEAEVHDDTDPERDAEGQPHPGDVPFTLDHLKESAAQVEQQSRDFRWDDLRVDQILTIPTASARRGDLIIELHGDVIKGDPVEVLQPQAHIYGAGKGPIGIRVDWASSRSTVCYLYVDQYPRITVRRPASHWTRFPVGTTVAHKDDDHAARSTAVVVEPTVDEWLDMVGDDLPAVLVEWRPAGRRVWEYAEDLQKI